MLIIFSDTELFIVAPQYELLLSFPTLQTISAFLKVFVFPKILGKSTKAFVHDVGVALVIPIENCTFNFSSLFKSVGKLLKSISSQTSPPPELPPALTGVTLPSAPIPRTLPEFSTP